MKQPSEWSRKLLERLAYWLGTSQPQEVGVRELGKMLDELVRFTPEETKAALETARSNYMQAAPLEAAKTTCIHRQPSTPAYVGACALCAPPTPPAPLELAVAHFLTEVDLLNDPMSGPHYVVPTNVVARLREAIDEARRRG